MQGDQLPVYPPNIQGELRLVLQNKDLFLLCYKYLEDYRRLNEEQNRIITKDFIESQIKIGDEEIDELQTELTNAEYKLTVRTRHNETLLGQLSVRGMSTLGDGSPRRNICRSPQIRKCPHMSSSIDMKSKDLTLFENIALAIEEIQREIKNKMKPLCDFYRDICYLQLHFVLVLTQICNYCMPLVTENVGLIDRVFFWSDRPEFELVRKSGEIADRLKDIFTRTQSVLTLLVENVMFLQNKVELQKNLERKFQDRLEVQQLEKDKVLRKIHGSRLDMDLLEEENDRLVGILVKLDPKYVESDHFNELADYSVRRHYLEGRLTPNGFKAHQTNVTPPPGGHSLNQNQILRGSSNSEPSKNETLSLNTHNNSLFTNINVSNIDKIESGKKIKTRKKKRDKKRVDKSYEKEMAPINSRKHGHKGVHTFTDESNLLESNKHDIGKLSIRDKLLTKTKSIFDSAFKKSIDQKQRNNYVKVFEGEILAELSNFNSTEQTPNSHLPEGEHETNSWDFSLERSLKRKYDLKESELHEKKPTRLKTHHRKKDKNLLMET